MRGDKDMLDKGTKVQVLKGKYKGEFGTVTQTRTDKNGVTRVQVKLAAGVFSYMLGNVELAQAEEATLTASFTL